MSKQDFQDATYIAGRLSEVNGSLLKQGAYVHAYPALCVAAQRLWVGPRDDGCIAGLFHLAYGWMPTILEVAAPWNEARKPLETLLDQKIRPDTAVMLGAVKSLQPYSQNSTVGLSKVLHFVRPDLYPIWDSRLAWVTRTSAAQQGSQSAFVSQAENYLAYIQSMDAWLKDQRIAAWLEENAIEGLKPYRLLEFALFQSTKGLSLPPTDS